MPACGKQFADVGVTLIAVFNAMRIINRNKHNVCSVVLYIWEYLNIVINNIDSAYIFNYHLSEIGCYLRQID